MSSAYSKLWVNLVLVRGSERGSKTLKNQFKNVKWKMLRNRFLVSEMNFENRSENDREQISIQGKEAKKKPRKGI